MLLGMTLSVISPSAMMIMAAETDGTVSEEEIRENDNTEQDGISGGLSNRDKLKQVADSITEDQFGEFAEEAKSFILNLSDSSDVENKDPVFFLNSIMGAYMSNDEVSVKIAEELYEVYGETITDTVKALYLDRIKNVGFVNPEEVVSKLESAQTFIEVIEVYQSSIISEPLSASVNNTEETPTVDISDLDNNTVPDDATDHDMQEVVNPLQESIEAAITQMRLIDTSIYSDESRNKYTSFLSEATEKVMNATTQDEIDNILVQVQEKGAELVQTDALEAHRSVALESLKAFFQGLNFSADELKAMADEEFMSAMEQIEMAVDEAAIESLLTQAEASLTAIMNETAEVISSFKENAADKTRNLINEITSSDLSVNRILELSLKKIESAESYKDVKAAQAAIQQIIADLKATIEGEKTSASKTIWDLRGLIESDLSSFTSLFEALSEKASIIESEKSLVLVNDALDAIEKDLPSYKVFLQKKLENRMDELADAQLVDIVNKAIEEISHSDGYRNAYTVYMSAVEAIETFETIKPGTDKTDDDLKKELEQIKENSVAELMATSDSSENMQKIVSTYSEKIKNAASKEEVYSYLEEGKELLMEAAKNETENKLAAMKDNVCKQLDALILKISDEELKAILQQVIDSAKLDVYNADSATEINTIVASVKAKIKEATSQHSENKELLTKQANLIAKLDSLGSTMEMSTEMRNNLAQAKQDILNTTSVSEAEATYNEAVSNIQKYNLAAMRKVYNEKLDNLLLGIDSGNGRYSEIQNLVNKAKGNIDLATTKELMENIYNNASANIDAIASAAAQNLDAIKESAIAELKSSTLLNTTSAEKVIATYTNKILNATTAEEVSKALSEGKMLLQKLNEAAGYTNSNGEAQINKNTFGSGTDSPDATEKGTDTVQSVKTGDDHYKYILLGFSAAVTSLLTICMVLRKKIVIK